MQCTCIYTSISVPFCLYAMLLYFVIYLYLFRADEKAFPLTSLLPKCQGVWASKE